jgi:hypothetical protein
MSTPDPATTEWVPLWQLGQPAVPDPGVKIDQGALIWKASPAGYVLQKIVDANVDVAAALSPAKFKNYPNDASKVLAGDGSWPALNSGANSVPIGSEIVLAGAAATMDWTSIPSTYKHLLLYVKLRSSAGGGDTGAVQFNGDTAGNYRSVAFGSSDAGTAPGATASTTIFTVGYTGHIPYSGSAAGMFAVVSFLFPYYADTSFNRVGMYTMIGFTSANSSGLVGEGYWNNSAAINRITVKLASGNLATGCRGQLYGMN